MLIMAFSARFAAADDVEYTLRLLHSSEYTEPTYTAPFSLDIKERVWVNSGIEEATSYVENEKAHKVEPQILRVEPAESAQHTSYLVTSQRIVVQPMPSIKEVLWPHTREILNESDIAYRSFAIILAN
jgi:hypothetical protein